MVHALGIDVGGTKIRAGLVSETGMLTDVKEVLSEAHLGRKHLLYRIEEVIGCYAGHTLVGIGIGTAGQVSWEGRIEFVTQNFPGWAGTPLQEIIGHKTGLPVRVINDVQAMAAGEQAFGEGKGLDHLVTLALGTGVGGAAILEGKLFRGSRGCAGEFGHMTIVPQGRLCPCGKRGCLEAYASGKALTDGYHESNGRFLTASQIVERARQGDPTCLEKVRELLHYLAIGIGIVVKSFDPQKVILGGGLSKGIAAFQRELEEQVLRELCEEQKMSFELCVSRLGGRAMLLGAASMVLNKD